MKRVALIISCEHAVNTIPKEYNYLFAPFLDLLHSHKGIDYGALEIAQDIKNRFSCDFVQAYASRLLIDCNRSLNHPNCFSKATRNLTLAEKQIIIEQYYLPYRQQVIALINHQIDQEVQVWHLSIHSFTPIMNNIRRNADIGFLYDPRRSSEKTLAKQWQLEIKKLAPEYRVRMNYPYNGISDGFTSALRKKYTDNQYVGIEIETNQASTQIAQKLDPIKNILSLSLFNLMC